MKNDEKAPEQVHEDSEYMAPMIAISEQIKSLTEANTEETSKGKAVFFIAVEDENPEDDNANVRTSSAICGDSNALYQGALDLFMDHPQVAELFISAGREALAAIRFNKLLNFSQNIN